MSDALADLSIGRAGIEESRRYGSLSKREIQVLAAISRGFTNQEVATQLQVSHKTVETYRARIYEKLGLKTRAELFQYALARGLVTGQVGEA